MDPSFWHERWQDGRIGFHRAAPNPQLVAHWPSLDLPPGATVLVPLCGKSVDLGWLASQGYDVVGAELSGVAVRAVFDEAGLTPTVTPSGRHLRFSVPGLTVYEGDFLDLTLPPVDAVWDRAATIALPPRLRARYAQHVARLVRPGGVGLLVTLDYPQTERDGPPFSVPEADVRGLYASAFEVSKLPCADDDGPPVPFPVSRCAEEVWRLTRR